MILQVMDNYIDSKFIICILKCIVLLPPPLPRDKERERERNKIAIQKKMKTNTGIQFLMFK